MKVSVFGIGYVGAVSAACLADAGHDVVAVDMEQVKIDCINEGRSPIIETDLESLIEKAVKNGKLRATLDAEDAIMNTDISLICVGTPSESDGSLNLKYVESLCETIGQLLARRDGFHTVVLRSTMVPGSAMNVALPILEKASGKKGGVDFGFGNNPEFLRESTAVFDYYNPPKIVVGALDDKTAEQIMGLYEGIDAPRVVADILVAEGVKYADNAWHATKVGFANEMGNILKDHGVDSHKVMDIFCMDTKLNISTYYMRPGFAFGGSCLPKDVKALRASAKIKGLKTPIFDALLEANDEQVKRAYDMIVASGAKKIGMLGVSFKAKTDDLRESPLVTLAELLLKNGYELSIYDANVYKAKMMAGANQYYINNVIPHISECLVETPEEMTEKSELFVVGNPGENFGEILKHVDPSKPIIDLVRIDQNLEKREKYQGICW